MVYSKTPCIPECVCVMHIHDMREKQIGLAVGGCGDGENVGKGERKILL